MRKILLIAGAFSAAYCVVTSSVLFTVGAAFAAHEYRLTNLAIGFAQAILFALIPAAAFGFVLGAGGALVVNAFAKRKTEALLAAATTGAILGCIPPAVARLWTSPANGMLLPFIPCIVVGSTCAIAWVLLFSARSAPAKV
jgi:hypothetical protein